MNNISDFEVIESVIKGNQLDYSIIIDRYKNKAFTLLKRMLKNEMEAEEVLQDCFLKAYNGLNNFKYESKFSTWFYKIVYNSALTKLSAKRRKIENEMSSIDEHFELQSQLDNNSIEQKDLARFINELVGKLPEKYASVINMFYLNEMSCEEISEITGNSVNNVKVNLYRGRNILRDLILKKNFSEELL